MEIFMHVQVVYRQGLVKAFVIEEGNMLMEEFMRLVRAEGKVKTIRFLPDVDRAAAELLVRSGNATRLGGRHEKV